MEWDRWETSQNDSVFRHENVVSNKNTLKAILGTYEISWMSPSECADITSQTQTLLLQTLKDVKYISFRLQSSSTAAVALCQPLPKFTICLLHLSDTWFAVNSLSNSCVLRSKQRCICEANQKKGLLQIKHWVIMLMMKSVATKWQWELTFYRGFSHGGWWSAATQQQPGALHCQSGCALD